MLKLQVDKLDDVEEALRPLYTEKEGKFFLDVDGIEDPTPLKRNLEAARRSEREMKKKVEQWEKLGMTEEEIVALKAKAEERQLDESEKKGEWEKLRQQMNDKHAAELKKALDVAAAKDKEIADLRTERENNFVEARVISAITAEKGTPQLLLPVVRRYVKVVEDSGRMAIEIVDDKGEPRVNGKGEPLTLAELVSEMRSSDIFGRAFEGTGSSGSGARTPNGSGLPSNITRRADFKSEKERAAYVDKYGISAYNALPLN